MVVWLQKSLVFVSVDLLAEQVHLIEESRPMIDLLLALYCNLALASSLGWHRCRCNHP